MTPAQRGLQAAFSASQREVGLRPHAQRAGGLLVVAALTPQCGRSTRLREATRAQIAPGQADKRFDRGTVGQGQRIA
ncbi:hypothetical protein G6F32_016665 [Rhizopus arrhizus]|nr:hypothetical protein G6F32_016665 [Rhizopus arrhizus]